MFHRQTRDGMGQAMQAKRSRPARAFGGFCAALLAALIGAAPAFANVGEAEVRRYSFEVTTNIVQDVAFASGVLEMAQTSEAYRIALDIDTRLPLTGIDRRDRLTTLGLRAADGARTPQRFDRATERKKSRLEVATRWDETGRPRAEVTRIPPRPDAARTPISPELLREATDPLTFLARILDQVTRTNGASCDAEHAIWDGQRLVGVATATQETVTAARIDCRLSLTRVEGLPYSQKVAVREETSRRVIRFRRIGLDWEPEFLRIEADFGVFKAEFTTTLERIVE